MPFSSSSVLPVGAVPAAAQQPRFVDRYIQCQTPELFNDRVYTTADWDRHVTWYRHLPEPRIFFRVFQAALPLIVWTTTWSVAVGLYYKFLEPLGAPMIVQRRDYAPVLQVASTALALLLVFRTNSSYGRWQEGRQLFGLMLNYARNVARLACGCVPAGPARDAVVRLAAAIAPAAASFLRQEPAMLRELCDGSGSGGGGAKGKGGVENEDDEGDRRRDRSPIVVLTPDELDFIERASVERGVPAPVAVGQAISQLLSRSGAHPIDRQAVEAQLSAMDVALGGCQRLAGSPVPMPYTRHSSRFLIAYLMLLPVTLFPSLRWLTVLVVILLTFFLGGIENVGVQIENPMRVLPLRALGAAYRDAALGMAAVSEGCGEWAERLVAAGGGDGGTGPAAVGGAGGARNGGGFGGGAAEEVVGATVAAAAAAAAVGGQQQQQERIKR